MLGTRSLGCVQQHRRLADLVKKFTERGMSLRFFAFAMIAPVRGTFPPLMLQQVFCILFYFTLRFPIGIYKIVDVEIERKTGTIDEDSFLAYVSAFWPEKRKFIGIDIESNEFPVRFLFQVTVQLIFINRRILTLDDHLLEVDTASIYPFGSAIGQKDSKGAKDRYEEFISQKSLLLNNECKTYFRKDNAH